MHRATAFLVSLATFALVACGSPLDTPDGGPPATAADGGGVCCPLTASQGCSSTGFFGGWAMTGAQCMTSSTADGPPHRIFFDDHGCAVLRPDLALPLCGQAIDAGADVSGEDAANDSPSPTDVTSD